MEFTNSKCPICNSEIKLEGRGGQVWIRGNLRFESKECYDEFDNISQQMVEIIDDLENSFDYLRNYLTKQKILSSEVISYLEDFWKWESAKISEAFIKRLDIASKAERN